MQLRVQRLFDKPGENAAAAPVTPADAAAPTPAPTPEPAKPEATTKPEATPAPTPTTPEAPKPAPTKDWKDDRIAKLTHDLNEARRAAAAPPPVQKPGESEADFNARVDAAASAKATQIAAQADWDRQCNAVADAGRKEFPDFNERLGRIQATVNGQDPAEVATYNEVISAAIETGQGHKVLYALGADPAEYQRLMKLNPVKRAMEIGAMSQRLVNDKEPSGAPKPITPIGSSGEHYEGIKPDDPTRGTKLPLKEWMKQREEQARARGIQ